MSDPVTIEDIYALFKASSEEFDRRLQESDRHAEEAKRENERTMSELKRTVAENTRAVNSLTTRSGDTVNNRKQVL